MRYDLPDETGEMRRERNARFGDAAPPAPDVLIQPVAAYLWDWYFSISGRLRRIYDGICGPIPPSEFQAWCAMTGTIVYPSEYAILCAMDDAYRLEMNIELEAYRARMEDERERKAKQG